MRGQANNNTAFSEKSKTKSVFHWEKWYNFALLLTVYDVITVNAAYFFALWARFDFRFREIPSHYVEAWLRMIPLCALLSIVVF